MSHFFYCECLPDSDIHSCDMNAASAHDLHYFQDVRQDYHDCMMLGDKGYLSTGGAAESFRLRQHYFGSSVSVGSEELSIAYVGIQKVPEAD